MSAPNVVYALKKDVCVVQVIGVVIINGVLVLADFDTNFLVKLPGSLATNIVIAHHSNVRRRGITKPPRRHHWRTPVPLMTGGFVFLLAF